MIVNIAGNEIELDLENGDMLVDILLIGRVQRADEPGESAVLLAQTDHTDTITRTGMLAITNRIYDSAYDFYAPGDDDD